LINITHHYDIRIIMSKKNSWQLIASLFTLSACLSSQAENITMGFGESLYPYVIKEENKGMELDVIRAALAYKKHTLIPTYAPLHSLAILFDKQRVDAINVTLKADLKRPHFYAKQPSIFYQDIMLTLEKSELTIKEPNDLKGLRVFAFHSAHLYHPIWLAPLKDSPKYRESSLQSSQVSLLHLQRVDVIVADENIIGYYTDKLKKEGKIQLLPTTSHAFAKPIPIKAVFAHQHIRDDFNEGLAHLKETGEYQKIIDGYKKGME